MQTELFPLIFEAIYEAAENSAKWPEAMNIVADAFGAEEAAIGGHVVGAPSWLVAPRSDPAFLRSYVQYYHQISPFYEKVRLLAPGTISTGDMLFPGGELVRSEFYNDWAQPQGFLKVIGSTLIVEDGWRTECQITGKKEFTDEHVRAYKKLVPHFVRALRLNQKLMAGDQMAGAVSTMLERSQQPVMMFDASARLIFANDQGEYLCRNGWITPGTGPLHQSLLWAGLHPQSAGISETLQILRTDMSPLSAVVITIKRDFAAMSAQQPASIVFISDPDQSTSSKAALLKSKFGLTEAEAAFAVEITKGDGKHAAAKRRGISFSTARTHLSRIFDKTGVRRQAELVRLLSEV